MPKNISLEEQIVAMRRIVNLSKSQRHIMPKADVDALWAVLETLTDMRMDELGKDPHKPEHAAQRERVRGVTPFVAESNARSVPVFLFMGA